ncbi:MAG: 6-carboxytetrahydropterin synthase [Brevinematales bacterium]|nr:6-carboxytetrahydropterin synthase [Brevinematales bacterium]
MGKWIISKSIEIDASHVVEGYSGPCARLHGHRWKIEISVEVDALNEIGIGVDFGDIKKALVDLNLDHQHLNDFISPATAESLAKYVYDEVKKRGIKLLKVTVWETPSNKVEYYEE